MQAAVLQTEIGGGQGAMAPSDMAELLAAFNDVTSRLQSSHERLRAEVARLTRELGEANEQIERSRRLAALGEMAAGIAHEVRNPLGSIRLYARMLDQDLADRPRERDVVGKVSAAVRVVETVVSDVLAFAREFKLRRARVEVGWLFDSVLEACCHEGVSGWRGVEVIRRDRAAGAAGEIAADEPLLRQALVNVVRNAFEAMAETPRPAHHLTLDARLRRVGDRTGSVVPAAILRVADTGPGVTPEVVARMFNPFFTTRDAGTGLGLAIVHRIVDAHAGRVVVRNNAEQAPGEPGACVELVIPQDESADAPERAGPEAQA